ncbi:MAG: diaminopimelate epimerase [Gammaproteobacteria bacterium]|nr:diaminopimelate epimerase [Gammaproteobacteria bacterium]
MTQQFNFSKMHGLGNDFVVIDAINQPVQLTPQQVRQISDRHFGVGCDQLLLVERPTRPDVDFRYRIFNADGGEVEQCGNGARCFARFVRDHGLSNKNEIAVETANGIIYPRIEADGEVSVNMGVPNLEPSALPFDAPARQAQYTLTVGDTEISIGAVSMGNPHAVQRVADLDRAPIATQGPLISRHPRFARGVNAGFMQIIDRSHIRLRVYERGAGETLACGTGACAAAVVGHSWDLLDSVVHVELRGGTLRIQWPGEGQAVIMTGSATHVFEGVITI